MPSKRYFFSPPILTEKDLSPLEYVTSIQLAYPAVSDVIKSTWTPWTSPDDLKPKPKPNWKSKSKPKSTSRSMIKKRRKLPVKQDLPTLKIVRPASAGAVQADIHRLEIEPMTTEDAAFRAFLSTEHFEIQSKEEVHRSTMEAAGSLLGLRETLQRRMVLRRRSAAEELQSGAASLLSRTTECATMSKTRQSGTKRRCFEDVELVDQAALEAPCSHYSLSLARDSIWHPTGLHRVGTMAGTRDQGDGTPLLSVGSSAASSSPQTPELFDTDLRPAIRTPSDAISGTITDVSAVPEKLRRGCRIRKQPQRHWDMVAGDTRPAKKRRMVQS